MVVAKCESCIYESADVKCIRCEGARFPVISEEARGLEVLEVKIRVQEPLHGAWFDFKVSAHDDGVMFETDYDSDEEGELRNGDAWAALDCEIGVDVRKSAVDAGLSAGNPFRIGGSEVAYAILPYDMAQLAQRVFDGK